MNAIYLDNAATTPLDPDVLDAMMPYWTERFGNPSSLHAFGRAARAGLNEARDRIAASLSCEAKQLIFTSGGTESDNLALFGIAARYDESKHLITTSVEHHALLHSGAELERRGWAVTYLPVDETGRIRIEDAEAAIRPDTALISVMYGNNEVGTQQPVEQVGMLARERGIPFHVDAVQALGAVELNLRELPVDLMSFSAHKIGGPKGVGLLYVSARTALSPQLFGGTQERGRRAGTENVAGIAGFARAIEKATGGAAHKRQEMETLRRLFLDKLVNELGGDGFVVNGHPLPEQRLPHIANVSFPGTTSETLLMTLDLEGVAASSGSACSSGALEVSHVLCAMNLPDERTQSAVRFSFGDRNTLVEVARAAQIVGTVVRRLRNKK